MKILLSLIISIICLITFSGNRISAEEDNSADLSVKFGIDEDFTEEVMGDETDAARFLRENGITADSADGITGLSPRTVFAYIWDKAKNSVTEPQGVLIAALFVIIFSAAAGAFSDSVGEGASGEVCRIISVLGAVATVAPAAEKCIETAETTLTSGGDFMLCYVPVFASIAAAAGNVTSAAAYNASIIVAAKAAVEIMSQILMPVLSVCMAMGIVDSITSTVNLSAVTELLKKWSGILIGLIMTVFMGLLSVQSVVGASTDTIASKAAKFVVSNCIPIVGSAVADAYSTVRAGLGMLRGAAGAFGVIAFMLIILPPIIETGCMYFAMALSGALAELFGAKELACFFRSAGAVFSIIIAVLACFAVMFSVSTIILMSVGLTAAGAA